MDTRVTKNQSEHLRLSATVASFAAVWLFYAVLLFLPWDGRSPGRERELLSSEQPKPGEMALVISVRPTSGSEPVTQRVAFRAFMHQMWDTIDQVAQSWIGCTDEPPTHGQLEVFRIDLVPRASVAPSDVKADVARLFQRHASSLAEGYEVSFAWLDFVGDFPDDATATNTRR